MKKNTTTLLAGTILAFSACSSGSSSTGTPTTVTPSLNATESSLLGKWFLIKEEQDWVSPNAHDTTITTSAPEAYIEFFKDQYAPASPNNYKRAQDARLAIHGSPVSSLGYWFYDESSARLNITYNQLEIITHTATSLVLKRTDMNMTTIQTFKK